MNEVEELLSGAAFVEAGGGDDLTMYTARWGDNHCVYVFDDGRWEHHDLRLQTSDAPEEAQGKGDGIASLKDRLTALTKESEQ